VTSVRAAWEHMRTLWPRWTLLPPAPFVLWSAYVLARGEARWEAVLFLVGAPLLAYATPRTKRLFVGVYPVGLVGVLYDAMRFVKYVGVTPERVHTCDLQALDARVFGVTVEDRILSWCDIFRQHRSPFLDAYCAIPYGTFLLLVVGYAIYLFMREHRALKRFAWAYLVLNVAGFVTYHVVPAAPPWYVHAYGCVVNLAAPASEGPKLAAVDAMIGVPYFAGFYGRSNDVFGALPSLHVAYPLLVVLEAWRLHGALGRALSIAFFVSMCFGAVYLDHHWVIDVVLGVLYGLGAHAIVSRWFKAEAP